MTSPHVRVCIGLAMLLIPVAIADFTLLGRSGGGWISLDFRGVFITAYLLFLPVHFIVSTIAVSRFPQASMWMIHVPSALVAIAMFSVGIYGYMQIRDRADQNRFYEEITKRQSLANVITLNSWSFSPNPDSATDIAISVTVSQPGRFAVGATGRDEGDYGEWYFQSENEEQRMVAEGEHFDYHIPIKRERYGVPKNIEITLYLFESELPDGNSIIKIFQSAPVITEDDGDYFHGPLPKPTIRP